MHGRWSSPEHLYRRALEARPSKGWYLSCPFCLRLPEITGGRPMMPDSASIAPGSAQCTPPGPLSEGETRDFLGQDVNLGKPDQLDPHAETLRQKRAAPQCRHFARSRRHLLTPGATERSCAINARYRLLESRLIVRIQKRPAGPFGPAGSHVRCDKPRPVSTPQHLVKSSIKPGLARQTKVCLRAGRFTSSADAGRGGRSRPAGRGSPVRGSRRRPGRNPWDRRGAAGG